MLPYPNDTGQKRLRTAAYLIAGLTEYWRAFRNYAGILHFCYLSGSRPDGWTSDCFADVEQLRLQPAFEHYVGEAFKALGVYLDFWQREVMTRSKRDLFVMLINDESEETSGQLELLLESSSGVEVLSAVPFSLSAFGQQTCRLEMEFPARADQFTLIARATSKDGESTESRRWVQTLEKLALSESAEHPQFGQF